MTYERCLTHLVREDESTPRRHRFDRSVERHGAVVIGGSPLRMFRLTPAGVAVADAIAAGRAVESSRLVDAFVDAGAAHPEPYADSPIGVDAVTVVTPTLGAPRHLTPAALVVDDGSRPPVAGATVRLPVNRGPAAARNAGSAAVATDFVAFVDADVDVGSDLDWLPPLLGHFSDERVAAVAPRVVSRDRSDALARYERLHSPLDLGPDPARVTPGTRVGYVPAAAVVVRTAALRSVGGFDELLRHGEDVDLVWRLVAAGWIVRYEPSIVVVHEPRSSWVAWLRQRLDYGSSAATLAARHGDAVAPVRTSSWSIATWTAALFVHPALGLGLAAGTAAVLVRRLRDVPPHVAVRLAGRGHGHAGLQFAAAVRRGWWPIVALAATRSAKARAVLAVSALAAGKPLRVVDDLAYSVGVWRGCMRTRSIDALKPAVTAWPARRR